MKHDDISIDLETMSSKFNSPILSIGACRFDRVTGNTRQTYYAEVQIDDALRYGRPSASTLQWWMKQKPEAQAVWQCAESQKMPLFEALRGLSDFVRSCNSGVKVWGNGSSFDITILEHAYERAGNGLVGGWEFWDIRDMRTIIDVAACCGFTKAPLTQGVAHNALDDAVHQAKEIARAFDWLTHGNGAGVRTKSAKQTPAAFTAVVDDEL